MSESAFDEGGSAGAAEDARASGGLNFCGRYVSCLRAGAVTVRGQRQEVDLGALPCCVVYRILYMAVCETLLTLVFGCKRARYHYVQPADVTVQLPRLSTEVSSMAIDTTSPKPSVGFG